MRLLSWILRGFLFFALFAFAVNNSQDVSVHWFFGHEWSAPLVIVVLLAFGAGCAIGVLAMVPAWWKHRRDAKRKRASAPSSELPHMPSRPDQSNMPNLPHLPPDGL